jgi:RNA polymerase sigma-70 factor (ECF subfamily)
MPNGFENQIQMPPEQDDFIQTRASLLFRIRDLSADESWKEFFETYWKLIYNTARHSGLSDAEAQDVVQETMMGLMRKLPEFQYDPDKGSFKGWLGKLVLWRVRDRAEKRIDYEQLEAAFDVADEDGFAAQWDTEWERNIIDAALERVKLRTSPKNYQIFGFCVLQKKGVTETARVLNVSPARVYLARHRISRLVKAEIEELKRNKFIAL